MSSWVLVLSYQARAVKAAANVNLLTQMNANLMGGGLLGPNPLLTAALGVAGVGVGAANPALALMLQQQKQARLAF
eukprot:1384065-Amorphochlora_amoeboformis.AAC.1